MFDSLIVRILIAIGFFLFFLDFIYILAIKKKSKNKEKDNQNLFTLSKIRRGIAVIGIVSLNVFLIYCCVYIFLYDILVIIIPRIDFFYNCLFLKIAGFTILIIGDVVLLISYKTLGRNWAYPIDTWKTQKKLVKEGIYSKIRHPIYLSFNIISIGFIILIQDWFLLILYFFGAIGLYNQAIIEEELLTQQFGNIYLKYIETTKRFL